MSEKNHYSVQESVDFRQTEDVVNSRDSLSLGTGLLSSSRSLTPVEGAAASTTFMHRGAFVNKKYMSNRTEWEQIVEFHIVCWRRVCSSGQ